jgi:hypothetical protein
MDQQPDEKTQGFFVVAVKWTQKLNLELSFETQSCHGKFKHSKIEVVRVEFAM